VQKQHRFNIGYLIIGVFVLLLVESMLSGLQRTDTVAFSEFQNELKQGRIAEVTVGGDTLTGELKSPRADTAKRVITMRVDPETAHWLDGYGVKYSAVHESTFLRDLLSWVVPALFIYGVWLLVFRRIAEKQGFGGGLMSIGKSKAKVYMETDTKVSFADVAGVDEAKAELQEIVNFLKDPTRHGRLGARLPKGVLLVGPPGTGKTLLARAVAGEAGVPFFSINGSEFVEMFVGVGAARVRDLFEQARQQAPAIIFIDELDALGRARGADPMFGGHDEKEQTLNQLLSEMDGFDPRTGLVLLAATNRPEILDPALLRAGRFDRQVLVDRPDKSGRVQILQVHVRKITLAAEVSLAEVAALTPGFSGADLANLVNEAALCATRRSAAAVSQEDFIQAIERIVAGLEKKNRLLNPKERRVVAYHELGHAFVALLLNTGETVQKVSIIPRGVGALGYTIQRPTEDRYLMSREELENKMAVLLGGRASEHLVFDEITTGAADDLVKATDIARSMVVRYGMIPEIGQVAYEDEPSRFLGVPAALSPRPRYSDETARRIDDAVRQLVDAAFARAESLLGGHRGALDRAAAQLLERETLSEAELRAALRPVEALPAASAATA
jgi:cell division protease FtsH